MFNSGFKSVIKNNGSINAGSGDGGANGLSQPGNDLQFDLKGYNKKNAMMQS